MQGNLKSRIRRRIARFEKMFDRKLNHSDVRFIISLAIKKCKPATLKALENGVKSKLPWQERLKWMERVNSFKGKKSENIEWLSVLYNSRELAEAMIQAKRDRVSGEHNPGYQHGGKFSVYSKNNPKFSPEKKAAAGRKLSKRMKNGSSSTNVKYWMKLGFNEEESKQKVRERQITFSLEKCIEKYGKEAGTKRWEARQAKWQNTLKSKSPEEIAEINKKKAAKIGPISKAEDEIYERLISIGLEPKQQFGIRRSNDVRWYYYDIVCGNKIIEYNGDYWHANPRKYDKDHIMKYPGDKCIRAEEVWKKDTDKIALAESEGYEVLVIWESDFNKNKNGIIEKCLNFLTK